MDQRKGNENSQKLNLKAKGIKDSDNVFQDITNKYPQLLELDLSDNNLTKLPRDLSKLTKLQSLDLRNNPFSKFENIADSLVTLPALIDLKIDLADQNQALLILNQLSKLQFLNGKTTKDETHIVDIEDKEIESITLQNEMSKFNEIFTKLTEKLKLINKEANNLFFEEFQTLLKNEIYKINNSVESTVPNYIYATSVITSQFKILGFFSNKFIDYLEVKDPDGSKIAKQINDNILKSGDLLINIINKLYPKIDEKTETLRNQLDEALKAAQMVDNEIAGFEEKIRVATRERDIIHKQYQDEKDLLLSKIERLESENRMMTEKLLKNAKEIISSNVGGGNIHMEAKAKEEQMGNMSLSGGFAESINKSKNASNVVIGPSGSRVLTIKMMRDIINEIYASKVEFDKKCMENKLPRETMEQHMYTYLNQKYGLKNLIIEWATSIINGIKMYSAEDSDVCLFGKILRNELEEDARLVLQRLKSTISDLLSYFLKSKNPLKPASEIKDLLTQKMNGSLVEEEWKGIIYYVYENDDAKNLENRIIDFIRKKGPQSKLDQASKKLTREEIFNLSHMKEDFKIAYKDFQKILLDYQIKSRDKYLKNFVILFKKQDTDNNGIINEEEFINLISSFNMYGDQLDENSQRFLSVIDPYNNKQITFSECVSLFSMEMLIDEDGKTKISLLDKICLEENIAGSN